MKVVFVFAALASVAFIGVSAQDTFTCTRPQPKYGWGRTCNCDAPNLYCRLFKCPGRKALCLLDESVWIAQQAAEDALEALTQFYQDAKNAFSDLKDAIEQEAEEIHDALVALSEDVQQALSEAFTELRSDVVTATSEIRDTVDDVISCLQAETGNRQFGGIGDAIGGIGDAIGDVVGNATDAVEEIVDEGTDAVEEIIGGATDAIEDAVEAIEASDILMELEQSLEDLYNKIEMELDDALEAKRTLLEAVNAMLQRALELGEEIRQILAEAGDAAADAIVDHINQKVQALVSAYNTFRGLLQQGVELHNQCIVPNTQDLLATLEDIFTN